MEDTGAMDAYEAQSAAERHMQELLDRLPRMQEIQARLEAHHAAGQILAKYACVDDLEGDIEELEARDPSRDGVNPELLARLIKEKRDSLARERARLDHDLAESRFANVPLAAQARIPQAEALALEEELNRYREDYAYTLARLQAAAR